MEAWLWRSRAARNRVWGRAACHLAIEQQRQPFGVGEITGLVLRLQLDEGIGHAVELEGSKLVDRWVCEHR